MREIANEIKHLCKSYSSLFFIDSALAGLFIALATFLYPNTALCGLFAIVFARILSKKLMVHQSASYGSSIFYNSLLVGLFIGHLFNISFLLIFFIGISIILTLMITVFLDALFKNYELPILSLPFVIMAIILVLISSQLTGISDATPYFIERGAWLSTYLPKELFYFLRALGSIFCIPDALFGGIIFVALFYKSPLMALLMTLGFFIGNEAEMIFKINKISSLDSHLFNYSLIFAALSSVFIFPSFKSLVMASLGTIVSSFILIASSSFFNKNNIPITALPFNFIVILMVRTLKSLDPAQLSLAYSKNPEETIDRSRLYRLRHAAGEVGVFCPFENTWTVQQSFNGEWTHKGLWRHALDFVKEENQKTFKEKGYELTDYYAFSKPVLSPMEGYVVGAISTLPDNLIGSVDNQNNWGNYLIIRSFGIYALLAHLKQDSLTVGIGDYVHAFQKIAECGNSGYSREPHIHLQIQYTPFVGAATAPFHLLNYIHKNNIHFHQVPNRGDSISAISKNNELDRALSFKIGEEIKYNLKIKDQFTKIVRIKILLDDITGTLYLSDENKARLYFGKTDSQFYFYGFQGKPSSVLADLFLAAPKIPMTYGESLDYQDYLPFFLTDNFFSRWIKVSINLFSPGTKNWPRLYYFNHINLQITGKNLIKGQATTTSLNLDPILGITNFTIKDRNYERSI